MSQFFASCGQSIGALAPASVLPLNIQGWFPLGLTGLILLSKGLSRVFSSTRVWKYQFFGAQPFLWFSLHISTWLLEKTFSPRADFPLSYHPVHFLKFNCSVITDLKTEFKLIKVVSLQKQTNKNNDEKTGNHANIRRIKLWWMNSRFLYLATACLVYTIRKVCPFFNFCDMYL